jgi:hypothetical protein
VLGHEQDTLADNDKPVLAGCDFLMKDINVNIHAAAHNLREDKMTTTHVWRSLRYIS